MSFVILILLRVRISASALIEDVEFDFINELYVGARRVAGAAFVDASFQSLQGGDGWRIDGLKVVSAQSVVPRFLCFSSRDGRTRRN